MARLPLEGVRIVDLTEVWAGPMGITYLADMGAEAIKVESFPRASITRSSARRAYTGNQTAIERPWDSSAIHNMANRNKYGVTLNLGTTRGLAILRDFVRVSDVFIESYSAGTSQTMGIDYQTVKEINSKIIMVSMPGWGVEGPYKGYVTLGSGVDAYSGHYGLRGYPDTDPTQTMSVVHSDAIGALTVAFAIMAALHYRGRTGKGQWIDLSQAEAFIPHLARPLVDYVMNKRLPSPMGNRDYVMAPHGCYRCRGDNAWVTIAVRSDEEWQTLCEVLGHAEWATDERFADVMCRHKNQDEFDILIQEWTSQYEKGEVVRILQWAGVPAGAVMDESDIYQDPHLKAREFFQSVTHSVVGEHLYPGFIWKFDKTPASVRVPPNSLGEHNQQVYGQLLGMSMEEIKSLEVEGIIGYDYSPAAGIDTRDQSS